MPRNIKERELVKKLCLCVGLLQPGDSRDVVIDVFHVLLKSGKRRKLMSVTEIEQKVIQNRKLHKVALTGIASSNIRRQIKRLRTLMLVEKIKSRYRITEFMPLSRLFSEKVEGIILPNILQRIKDYFQNADEIFAKR